MQLGREPTNQELAEELGWPLTTVEQLRKQRQVTVSLETPVGEEEEGTLADFIPDMSGWSPDELAVARLTRQEVMQALEKLRSSRTLAPVLDPRPQNAPAGLESHSNQGGLAGTVFRPRHH